MRTMPLPALSDFEESGHFNANDYMAVIYQRSNVYSIVASLSKIAGPHSLKFGGELRIIQFNFNQVNPTSGTFTFNNLMTAVNPSAPAGTGYSFASFMLGIGSSGTLVNSTLFGGTGDLSRVLHRGRLGDNAEADFLRGSALGTAGSLDGTV